MWNLVGILIGLVVGAAIVPCGVWLIFAYPYGTRSIWPLAIGLALGLFVGGLLVSDFLSEWFNQRSM